MDPELGRLARKAYLSYHQDGVLDLLIGGIAIGIGLGIASRWIGSLALICLFLVGPIYAWLKERVTIPRMGYVEFRPDPVREASIKVIYPIAVCVFMVVFLLWADVPTQQAPAAPVWTPSRAWPGFRLWMADKGLLLGGVVAMAVLGLLGLGTGLRRMYAYGILALVFLAAGHGLRAADSLPVFALGITIVCSGVVVLVRFLRRFPAAPIEDSLAGGQDAHAAR